MILSIVIGAFCAAAVAVLLRPIRTAQPPERPSVTSDERHQPRALLRQLRDLDDDHAFGKLGERDYASARRLLLRRAADALTAPQAGTGTSTVRAASSPPTSPVKDQQAQHHGPRRIAVLLLTMGLGATVLALLYAQVHERPTGTPVTGGTAAAAPRELAPGTGPLPTPGTASGQRDAVRAAVAGVTRHPRSISAHLELARAYTDAVRPQLATVEYLAAARLDPGNAEANTALAMLAFTSGSAEQAQALANTALAAHPGYPEALYVRGLIRAIGLHHLRSARNDLHAYLRAAPFGSHKATVATVLALIDGRKR